MRKKIFISYRRSDTEMIAVAIYDRVVQAFGAENVFKDVDSIAGGEDFSRVLEETLAKCEAVLLLIGTTWLTTAIAGVRRLEDPSDFVRQEVESSLRHDALVIPILIGSAKMPTAVELPASLQPLCSLNARRVRAAPDFHRDMDRVIEDLGKVVKPKPKFLRGFYLGLLGLLGALFALILAFKSAKSSSKIPKLEGSRDNLVALLKHRESAFLDAVHEFDLILKKIEDGKYEHDERVAILASQALLSYVLPNSSQVIILKCLAARLGEEESIARAPSRRRRRLQWASPGAKIEREELHKLKARVVSVNRARIRALQSGNFILAHEQGLHIDAIRRDYLNRRTDENKKEIRKYEKLIGTLSIMHPTAHTTAIIAKEKAMDRYRQIEILARSLRKLLDGANGESAPSISIEPLETFLSTGK